MVHLWYTDVAPEADQMLLKNDTHSSFSEELTTLSLHPWEGSNILSYLEFIQVILHQLFEFQHNVAQYLVGTEQYHIDCCISGKK